MRIQLIAVGQKMPAWVQTGWQDYCQRLPKSFQLQLIEIPLAKRHSRSPIQPLIQQEGTAITQAIPSSAYVMALDQRGQSLTSEQLARKIETMQLTHSQLALLVGGPDGLAPDCLTQADFIWSLSPLTLPHPLVRLVVAETIYRSWSILQRHPYHR
ncbi:MAG: 23S rRNA (pseudouridine(1915)-N(3))-methyltransferase RlmH [Legionellales bacterium]|nr:23S rRNA (pseudouridine(1915)-N(3))-methyltransferase RlmH [Legionellales bacterium]